MAKKITVGLTISGEIDGAKVNRNESFTATITGNYISHDILLAATAGEVLVESADLGTAGLCFVKNLDKTNYITLGSTQATNHAIKLLPGESTLFRATGPVYAQANTSTCKVEYIIIDT